MDRVDLKKLMQRVVELVMPNLRHYYRVPRKGRVVKSYASNGSYWADVQPLRNDDSDDSREPVITRIEIPILWGGPERGVVCPPAEGTLCDITYYDGDPDFPRISNFRWARNKAPNCGLGGFIIQQRPGVFISITPAGGFIHQTDQGMENQMEKDKVESIGGDWNVTVTGSAVITSPEITVIAAIGISLDTPELNISGSIVAGGDVADQGGTKTMAAMRDTYDGHTHPEHGTGGGTTSPPTQEM